MSSCGALEGEVEGMGHGGMAAPLRESLSCGVVSKKREKGTPPLPGSFSCAITIGSLSSRACLTCSASRSSLTKVSSLR